MTPKLEIPPAAVDALADDLAGRLIASGIDRHYAAYEGLQKALPHLLDWFAERLTSDEVVEELASETWSRAGIEWDGRSEAWRSVARDNVREFLARAAALLPGREDGTDETA